MNNGRKSFIENILNRESLQTHVVVSSIQSLYHVAEEGDEKYLLPLLDCDDKIIAGCALDILYTEFHLYSLLKNKILQYASTYPEIDDDGTEELQCNALFCLQDMASNDMEMFNQLVEIAENYKWIQNTSEVYVGAANNNVSAWEFVAKLVDVKITSTESEELYWNIHSETSELIRNKIREGIRKYRDTFDQYIAAKKRPHKNRRKIKKKIILIPRRCKKEIYL
jgi:hypothetical protein